MPAYRTSVTYRDAKGQTAKTGFYTVAADLAAAAPAAQAVIDAISAVTVAAFASAHGPAESPPTTITYGGAGAYSAIECKAQIAFTDVSGSVHRYQIPAPIAAAFLADDETLNPANAAVAALIAAMTDGTTASRSGDLLTGFLGGGLIRRRTQRRFSIITKNPALTGPGL